MQAKRFLPKKGQNDEGGPNCAMTYFVPSATAVFLESNAQIFSDSGLAEIHSLREKAVREDIARRLGQVCSNFPEDDFEDLVAEMAARQVKCERRPMW